jgi:hypothetical protein
MGWPAWFDGAMLDLSTPVSGALWHGRHDSERGVRSGAARRSRAAVACEWRPHLGESSTVGLHA